MTPLDAIRRALDASRGSAKSFQAELADAGLIVVSAARAADLLDIERRTLPRCGDHVLHRPSGEEWVVAWAEGADLAPAGWPNSLARVADCDVTFRCSDEAHRQSVEDWRASTGEDGRRARVLRLYGALLDGREHREVPG